MGNINSKELAFFSILRNLLSPNIKDEIVDIDISLDDLEEKTEIDKKIIAGFIEGLRSNGLIDVLNYEGDNATLHFEKTGEKLLSLISIGELESTLKGMNRFIFKNLALFNFSSSPIFKEVAMEVKMLLDKNPNANLNPIIRNTLSTYFSSQEAHIKISKLLYHACEVADEEDAKLLESILYFYFMLPPEENPFLTTLILTKISLELELMKSAPMTC
jgi:hypothetical protein